MKINKILSENWKIFILTTIVAIIFLGINLGWPYIQDELWGKHPDTYICVVGMNDSYTSQNLLVTVKTIKFPNGVSNVDDLWMPLQLFNWTYPNSSKFYTMLAQNRGDGIAKNVRIKIDFYLLDSIESIEITHEDRIEIIEGGITGSYVVFKIPELLPGEKQAIRMLINHKNLESISVWSETEGDIKNIYIYDYVFEVPNN